MSTLQEEPLWYEQPYRDMIEKDTALKNATKLLKYLFIFGFIIFLISFFAIANAFSTIFDPSAKLLFPNELIYLILYAVLLIIGFILVLWSSRRDPKLFTPKLSPEERAFLKLYPALTRAQLCLKDDNPVLKKEASNSLRKFANFIEDNWDYGSLGLIQMQIGPAVKTFVDLCLWRLAPSMANATQDNVKDVLSILNDIAHYLLQPNLDRMLELNKRLAILPEAIKHPSFIRAHINIINTTLFVSCSFFASEIMYYILSSAGFSRDTSLQTAAMIFIGLLGIISGWYFTSKRQKESIVVSK